MRSILRQNAPGVLERIEWRKVASYRARSLPSRLRQGSRLIHQALSTGERVLFTSISRALLLQLKRSMRRKDLVCTIFHGDLELIGKPSTERFPQSLFSLRRILLRPHPAGLRYFVLGQSILDSIPPDFHRAMASTGAIDHPYHVLPIQPVAPSPPVFGVLGNTGDGRLLEQVARQVKAVNPEVRFRLIGFLQDVETVARLRPLVEDAGSEPIPREIFAERASRITHVLWLAAPGAYRLRASGTFFDALAHAKPLVYTANPFIDQYVSDLPSIGIRCATPEEAAQAVLGIAARQDAAAYTASVEAIARLRLRFTPESLAERLPAALAWD
ncbi:MAG TPA: hypothetical protein VGC07_02750 [Granulicella sp.]